MEITSVHIGEIIRQKIKEMNISQAQFAKALNIQRQNIKKTVFEKHGIDTDLLCTISNYLGCNLFDYYTDRSDCAKPKIVYKPKTKVVKATLSIEMGPNKDEKDFSLVFGENSIHFK